MWSSLLLAAILGAPAHAAEWIIECRVVGVSDGDTIILLDRTQTQHKIRLHGIDAPEKGQAFGERSRESLSHLAFGLEVTGQCHKRDRYGREVCKIMRRSTDVKPRTDPQRDGVVVSPIREGANRSGSGRLRGGRAGSAREARGLWKDAVPLPPWEWRKSARAERARAASFPSH
jgi:endonuclease YncB( thermonuclease family)